jgi:uncharacterized RDD family membrane protein YckC
LSTQPNRTPQWKEEVNRRLAAHKSRKNQPTEPEAAPPLPAEGASRAAQAAARVAARYAKAPSYSQLQAEGARVAVRAAEIATKVALEAQAAAESALAGLHAATHQQPRGPAVVQPIAPLRKPEVEPAVHPSSMPVHVAIEDHPVQTPMQETASFAPETTPPPQPAFDRRDLGIRWDPDMPILPVERKPAARRPQDEFELSTEDWWQPAELGDSLRNTPIEIAEEETHSANLIHFPRELVATRKLRPRLAEAVGGEADAGQLSIFEVDPASISTEAAVVGPEPGGMPSTWSGMRLDSQPEPVRAGAARPDWDRSSLPVAPLGLRLMATVVDCALILATFVGAGFLAARQFAHPPTGKPAELMGLAALVLIGLLYYAFFFAFPVSTPGMMYARIGLCTFNNQSPTRDQLRRRVGAMVLSLLPVGLGLVWSLFDEDHLSWHDRFSQTYLRKL